MNLISFPLLNHLSIPVASLQPDAMPSSLGMCQPLPLSCCPILPLPVLPKSDIRSTHLCLAPAPATAPQYPCEKPIRTCECWLCNLSSPVPHHQTDLCSVIAFLLNAKTRLSCHLIPKAGSAVTPGFPVPLSLWSLEYLSYETAISVRAATLRSLSTIVTPPTTLTVSCVRNVCEPRRSLVPDFLPVHSELDIYIYTITPNQA